MARPAHIPMAAQLHEAPLGLHSHLKLRSRQRLDGDQAGPNPEHLKLGRPASSGQVSSSSSSTWMMPLKVAATSVKLAIPPPTRRARFPPSELEVAQPSSVRAYWYVSALLGAPVGFRV